MKTTSFFPVLIIQALMSCTYYNENQAEKPIKTVKLSEQSIKHVAPVESTDTTRQVNEYIGDILAYRKPLQKRNLYKVTFKNEVSSYDESIIDTILTLSKGRNKFTYYTSGSKKAIGEAALMNFTIETDSIYLPDSIHVMMTKTELIKKLKLTPFNGRLRITEEEGYQQLYFTFRKDTLVRIAFESSYID